MICRVAESCFWMLRYVERAESVARLLEANQGFVLDADVPLNEHWMPVVVVAGEEAPFLERHGRALGDDGEFVQQYLCWDEQCPISLMSSARWARENARTIREVISLEMWQAINGFWIWITSPAARALYMSDRRAFFAYVKSSAQQLRGLMEDTLPHDEPYEFMRLGLMLERANQVARQLDVKHHKLERPSAPRATGHEGIEEFSLWDATLRACSATEAFMRQGRPLLGQNVLRFLVLDPDFPRSIFYSITRAQRVMNRIIARGPAGQAHQIESAKLLDALAKELEHPEALERLVGSVHNEMTRIVDTTALVCVQLQRDFFG